MTLAVRTACRVCGGEAKVVVPCCIWHPEGRLVCYWCRLDVVFGRPRGTTFKRMYPERVSQ